MEYQPKDMWSSMKKIEKGSEPAKEELIVMSEISLILDTYEDIFSDFDPRPYSVRALSEDFLSEAKRGSLDKIPGEINLILMVPKKLRNPKDEEIIAKRLKYHFKKHYLFLKKELMEKRRKGFLLLLVGALVGGLATVIYPYHSTDFLAAFGVILLEPASWFTMWTGLEQMFHISRQDKTDMVFYERMDECKISFLSY